MAGSKVKSLFQSTQIAQPTVPPSITTEKSNVPSAKLVTELVAEKSPYLSVDKPVPVLDKSDNAPVVVTSSINVVVLVLVVGGIQ